MPEINDLERRALGHLPEWVADETAFTAAHPQVPRCYSLADYTAFLATDPHAVGVDPKTLEVRPLSEAECANLLVILESRGFALHEVRDGVSYWQITQAGHEALDAPPDAPNQIPAPADLPLDPVTLQTTAEA